MPKCLGHKVFLQGACFSCYQRTVQCVFPRKDDDYVAPIKKANAFHYFITELLCCVSVICARWGNCCDNLRISGNTLLLYPRLPFPTRQTVGVRTSEKCHISCIMHTSIYIFTFKHKRILSVGKIWRWDIMIKKFGFA